MRRVPLVLFVLVPLILAGCGRRTVTAPSAAPPTAAPPSAASPTVGRATAAPPAISSPTGARPTAASSAVAATAAPPTSAGELALVSGKVITVDARDTIAQAVFARDGKIVKAGSNAEIQALIGPQTLVLDLKGKTVTPGLVDSHIHVGYYGRQFDPQLLNIRYPEVRTKADLLRLVGERAKAIARGEWVSGNQGFLLTMQETPTLRELDSVSPDNPVYLRHSSGQYSVVNSLALTLAGITKDTPNPYGSVIGKNPVTKEPNGLLFHYPAENLVGRIATGYGTRTFEQIKQDILLGARLALAEGYTSGQDVIVSTLDDIKAYKELADQGQLPMRIYILFYVDSLREAELAIKSITPFKSDMCTFGGWKLAMDGGVAAGTVLMYDTSLPAASGSYPYHTQETLNQIVTLLHKTGLQTAIHVGGDRGMDICLDAFEAAMKAAPRQDPRFRLEHAVFPTQQNLERMKQLGVVASTQPQWIRFHGDGFRLATSEEVAQRTMPLKTILSMGIPLAFGCDVPATIEIQPIWAFVGATSRNTSSGTQLNPAERISVQEALRAHTMGSAYAAFQESIVGSLEPGRLADLVVWSHDLYTMSAADLGTFRAEVTIVGGKVVYRAADSVVK